MQLGKKIFNMLMSEAAVYAFHAERDATLPQRMREAEEFMRKQTKQEVEG